eukprot:scaffold787_cov113-Amphora_coffeaeformis.AAC.2
MSSLPPWQAVAAFVPPGTKSEEGEVSSLSAGAGQGGSANQQPHPPMFAGAVLPLESPKDEDDAREGVSAHQQPHPRVSTFGQMPESLGRHVSMQETMAGFAAIGLQNEIPQEVDLVNPPSSVKANYQRPSGVSKSEFTFDTDISDEVKTKTVDLELMRTAGSDENKSKMMDLEMMRLATTANPAALAWFAMYKNPNAPDDLIRQLLSGTAPVVQQQQQPAPTTLPLGMQSPNTPQRPARLETQILESPLAPVESKKRTKRKGKGNEMYRRGAGYVRIPRRREDRKHLFKGEFPSKYLLEPALEGLSNVSSGRPTQEHCTYYCKGHGCYAKIRVALVKQLNNGQEFYELQPGTKHKHDVECPFSTQSGLFEIKSDYQTLPPDLVD